MPSVPNVPGVPTLSSYSTSSIVLLVADAVSFLFGAPVNVWGVYRNGTIAFDYDSFNSLGRRKEFVVADYPVEAPQDGTSSGFMSYDKVELPGECRVRLVAGGSEQDREALISEVEAAAATLDLFDIVTPERLYRNYNIERVSYERTSSDGVGLVKIDISFKEIRSSAASSFTNTQQPGSSSQQGLGNVQPITIPNATNVQDFPSGNLT